MAKTICRALLAAMFIGSGFLHFVRPAPFVAIVPPYLPAARALVLISGAFEILGGVGLLVPKLRRWAGMGLVLLLLAVYPANIFMATNDVPLGQWHVPWWGHAIRLPLQFVFIALVVWVVDVRRAAGGKGRDRGAEEA
jgi:uncharacterized membrane protein